MDTRSPCCYCICIALLRTPNPIHSFCPAGGVSSSHEHVEHRSSGSLQGFAEVLLRRVPFTLLEAQVWLVEPQSDLWDQLYSSAC